MRHNTAVLEPILGQLREPAADGPDADRIASGEPDEGVRASVIELLGPAPVSIDDLVRLSNASPATVRTILLELEIAGRVERHGGGLFSLA